jgi:hypothetical protein
VGDLGEHLGAAAIDVDVFVIDTVLGHVKSPSQVFEMSGHGVSWRRIPPR